jgi:signal transduction histidine kinase
VLLPWGECDAPEEDAAAQLERRDRSQVERWGAALAAETEGLGAPPPELSRPAERMPGEPPRSKVLVVEDNDGMRHYLQSLLAEHYEVAIARDGREGFEAARDDVPSLVVSDVMMPVMTGIELCVALAEDPRTSEVPVLMLTAKADRQMTVEGLQSGARDYVAKPFHPQELLARVESLVRTEELRKQLDQRNHRLEAALFELKETQVQLVQAERLATAGELAAGLAHEVNNPVNSARNAVHAVGERVEDIRSILAAVARLDQDSGPDLAALLCELRQLVEKPGFEDLVPKLEELVTTASDGLERTRRLVDDLRGFTGSKRRGPVDVREGLDATIRLMRPTLGEDAVPIECEYDPELPHIDSSSSLLNQVFFNLLKNASEAMEGREGEIHVAAFRDQDAVVVEVSDDGPGISDEVRERLFEPFVTSKSVGKKGSGLGLAICRRILLDLGGRIDVGPAEGEGASFSVRLPIGDPRGDRER